MSIQLYETAIGGTAFGGELSETRLEELSSDLRQLLQSGEASDAQLKCGDVVRPVHRCVLAGRSPVFAAMFRSKMEEGATGVVHIEDFDANSVDKFLDYVYTGKLAKDCPVDTLRQLYAMGDKYAVQSLKKLCSDMLIKNLSVVNFVELLQVAVLHQDAEFKEEVVQSIVDHPLWLNCEMWCLFSDDNLKLGLEVHRRVYKKYFKGEDAVTSTNPRRYRPKY